jgi:hypothetical protein
VSGACGACGCGGVCERSRGCDCGDASDAGGRGGGKRQRLPSPEGWPGEVAAISAQSLEGAPTGAAAATAIPPASTAAAVAAAAVRHRPIPTETPTGGASSVRAVEDCGVCKFCRDKPKFGGQNSMKQRCVRRSALAMQLEAMGGVGQRHGLGQGQAAQHPRSHPAHACPPHGAPCALPPGCHAWAIPGGAAPGTEVLGARVLAGGIPAGGAVGGRVLAGGIPVGGYPPTHQLAACVFATAIPWAQPQPHAPQPKRSHPNDPQPPPRKPPTPQSPPQPNSLPTADGAARRGSNGGAGKGRAANHGGAGHRGGSNGGERSGGRSTEGGSHGGGSHGRGDGAVACLQAAAAGHAAAEQAARHGLAAGRKAGAAPSMRTACHEAPLTGMNEIDAAPSGVNVNGAAPPAVNENGLEPAVVNVAGAAPACVNDIGAAPAGVNVNSAGVNVNGAGVNVDGATSASVNGVCASVLPAPGGLAHAGGEDAMAGTEPGKAAAAGEALWAATEGANAAASGATEEIEAAAPEVEAEQTGEAMAVEAMAGVEVGAVALAGELRWAETASEGAAAAQGASGVPAEASAESAAASICEEVGCEEVGCEEVEVEVGWMGAGGQETPGPHELVALLPHALSPLSAQPAVEQGDSEPCSPPAADAPRPFAVTPASQRLLASHTDAGTPHAEDISAPPLPEAVPDPSSCEDLSVTRQCEATSVSAPRDDVSLTTHSEAVSVPPPPKATSVPPSCDAISVATQCEHLYAPPPPEAKFAHPLHEAISVPPPREAISVPAPCEAISIPPPREAISTSPPCEAKFVPPSAPAPSEPTASPPHASPPPVSTASPSLPSRLAHPTPSLDLAGRPSLPSLPLPLLPSLPLPSPLLGSVERIELLPSRGGRPAGSSSRPMPTLRQQASALAAAQAASAAQARRDTAGGGDPTPGGRAGRAPPRGISSHNGRQGSGGRGRAALPPRYPVSLGAEAWVESADTSSLFRDSFGAGVPVVVRGVGQRMKQDWTPRGMARQHGQAQVRGQVPGG